VLEKQHEGLTNKKKKHQQYPTIISSGNFLQFVKAMAIYFVDLPNLKMGQLPWQLPT
jgi:hypothetical protein